MGKNCKTCKKPIQAQEKTYTCVACNCHIHMTTIFTGLAAASLNVIIDLGNNIMLLCNGCVDKNERDKFIRCRTMQIENLDFSNQLKNMEKRLTELVDKKIETAIKTNCEKVNKTYAAVVSVESTQETDRKLGKLIKKEKGVDNIKQKFRLQGIPEDQNKTKAENLGPTTDEVNEILSEIGVRPEVKEVKRLGEFKRERKKPRTLLVTVANEHEARLALAKIIEHRKELAKRNIYLLPALSKEDALKENLILKKKRELLTEGVPRDKLKIRNLELFNDGAKVEIASVETKSN